jgi:diguanylate cyclase (GGDEF)-like protein
MKFIPSSPASPAGTPATLHPLKLRLLKLLLSFGTVAVAITWFFETYTGRINATDRVAYPTMIVLFLVYLIMIYLRPSVLPVAELLSFSTFAGYIIIYLQLMLMGLHPNADLYELATFGQWFPLVYTAAYIFLETRHAMFISILIYLSLLVPSGAMMFGDGNKAWANDSYAILLTMNISHPVYIAVLSGIAQLKEHFVRARAHADVMSIAASIDHLTGTNNRRAIAQILQQAIGRAQAGGGELAVILLDIDNFKQINDTYGHDVGDQTLIEVADSLRQQLRATDALGRWGGEEFMIIIPETNLAATVQLAERLRALIEARSQPPLDQVTVSFGVAISLPGDTPDRLVKRADEALYRAKQGGRNRVEVADKVALK